MLSESNSIVTFANLTRLRVLSSVSFIFCATFLASCASSSAPRLRGRTDSSLPTRELGRVRTAELSLNPETTASDEDIEDPAARGELCPMARGEVGSWCMGEAGPSVCTHCMYGGPTIDMSGEEARDPECEPGSGVVPASVSGIVELLLASCPARNIDMLGSTMVVRLRGRMVWFVANTTR